jgi:hypothetical protein
MRLLPGLRREGYAIDEVRIVDERGKRAGGFGVRALQPTLGSYISVLHSDLSRLIHEALDGKVRKSSGRRSRPWNRIAKAYGGYRPGEGLAVAGGHEWRLPIGIGLQARIVVWIIVEQHRTVRPLQKPQGGQRNPAAGIPGRSAGREAAPARTAPGARVAAWYSLGLRPDQAERDRRQSLLLQIVSKRAHGARAHRSDGGKKDRIDAVLLEQRGKRAGMRLHRQRDRSHP